MELHGGETVERARVGCVGAEVGQGAHTAFILMTAEMLGLSPEQVELEAEDTDVTGSSGSSSASRMTFMAGNAIQGAAERAMALWRDEERPARAEFVYHPRATTPFDRETGACDPNITYGYCAQVADVEVDRETGHVTVRRLISVNDVGRAIHPQHVEGQIEGAVAQSIGWTLLENYLQEGGVTITPQLSNYLIPGRGRRGRGDRAGDPGAAGPAGAAGCAGDGGDAVSADGAGYCGGAARCARCLVRCAAVYAGGGVAGYGVQRWGGGHRWLIRSAR